MLYNFSLYQFIIILLFDIQINKTCVIYNFIKQLKNKVLTYSLTFSIINPKPGADLQCFQGGTHSS